MKFLNEKFIIQQFVKCSEPYAGLHPGYVFFRWSDNICMVTTVAFEVVPMSAKQVQSIIGQGVPNDNFSHLASLLTSCTQPLTF